MFDPFLIAFDAERDWQPPDSRTIYEWAADNVTLPRGGYAIPGRFSIGPSNHLRDVFHDLQDPLIRQSNILKATQSAGTLAADIWLCWLMANDPGPALWNFQDEAAAKMHAKTRLMPLLKTSLRHLLPENRHDMNAMDIIFNNGVPFNIQAATMGRLQSRSIRYMINDECWQWDAAMLKEADARVDAYRKYGMEKVLNISQGGTENTDWHRLCFDAGTELWEWQVPCEKCGAFQIIRMEDENKHRLMTWDDSGGNIRYSCVKCGEYMTDSPQLKAHFNESGRYVCGNVLPFATRRTRRWNAFVWTSWEQLVREYREALDAKKMGVLLPLQKFIQKKLAEFWREDDSAPIIQPATFDVETTLATGQGVRFLTIDVQTDHLWCLVREWQNKGESRLIHWSRALTFSDAHEIAKRYGIIEGEWQALKHWVSNGQQGPRPRVQSAVLIDTGGDRTQDVYDACWRYGWIGLKGASDTREYFTHRKTVNGNAVEWPELYDQKDSVLNYESRGSHLPLLLWSTIGAKNILVNLRDGKGARWEVPKNIGYDYMRQINSEIKEQNGDKWRWKKLGSRANHAWDCEAMQVLAASMAGIFKLS